MKKKHNRSLRSCNCNYNCSRIGDQNNCSNSSTSDFAKNKGIITDNEYEVTNEHNCNINNKKKRSK